MEEIGIKNEEQRSVLSKHCKLLPPPPEPCERHFYSVFATISNIIFMKDISSGKLLIANIIYKLNYPQFVDYNKI